MIGAFHKFFQHSAFSAVLLLIAALSAFVAANSPWAEAYHHFWNSSFRGNSLHFWVNDALMAVFFLLVGLEIKRELLVGELSTPRQAVFPLLAAAGGMLAPGLLYVAINPPGSAYFSGWGIPTVTDIAFAIGVLALLGDRVPLGLKIFLTALAIIDDLGAVLIIALFYSNSINLVYLLSTFAMMAGLWLMNRLGVRNLLGYLLVGVVLWWLMLKSGVHPTLAGVLLALSIPADSKNKTETEQAKAPLQRLEHALNPWVAYGIMPMFALANAGVGLGSHPLSETLAHPVTLGVMLGLLLGKPLGITGVAWLSVRMGLAALPNGVGWLQVFGASCLGGIGFTMSIFIANLAFQEPVLIDRAKIGILSASLLAGMLGCLALWRFLPKAEKPENT